ncbi:unnamed protein product, partial [Protopolystoma xenopodis]
ILTIICAWIADFKTNIGVDNRSDLILFFGLSSSNQQSRQAIKNTAAPDIAKTPLQHIFSLDLTALWMRLTDLSPDLSISQVRLNDLLTSLLDDKTDILAYQAGLQSTIINYLRKIHPNTWPSWILKETTSLDQLDAYIRGQVYDKSGDNNTFVFYRYLGLWLPIAILQRCISHTNLVGRLRKLAASLDDPTIIGFSESNEGESNKLQVAEFKTRLLETIAGLASVRVVSPVHTIPLFSIVFAPVNAKTEPPAALHAAEASTSSFNNDGSLFDWLLCSDPEELCLVKPVQEGLPVTSGQRLRSCLSGMLILETAFLLHQPWQWRLTSQLAEKAISTRGGASSQPIGLVQLGFRLDYLKPRLSRDQWKSAFLLILEWASLAFICIEINLLNQQSLSNDSNCIFQHHRLLFAFRAFRMLAALSAVFVEKACFSGGAWLDSQVEYLSGSYKQMAKGLQALGEVDEDEEKEDEAEKGLEEEEDKMDETNEDGEQDRENAISALLEIENEDWEEEEATEGTGENADSSVTSLNPPNQTRRLYRPPISIRSEWTSQLQQKLFSMVVPAVLSTCLSQEASPVPKIAQIDTPNALSALCALMATCPAEQLVYVLTDQPRLEMEFLGEAPQLLSSWPVARNAFILSDLGSKSVRLSPGLRAGLELASRLLVTSPYQAGQLLGHRLLCRLLSLRGSAARVSRVRLSDAILASYLPPTLLAGLAAKLPSRLEAELSSGVCISRWAIRPLNADESSCLLGSDLHPLDPSAHQHLLGFLLAWDAFVSLVACSSRSTRVRLQQLILSGELDSDSHEFNSISVDNSTSSRISVICLFDRFLLVLGRLMPDRHSLLSSLVDAHCRLEPDERLLLSHLTTGHLAYFSNDRPRTTVNNSHRVGGSRSTRSYLTGGDRRWCDPTCPADPLVQLPSHRMFFDLSHLAIRLFRRLLAQLPTIMRAWFIRLNSFNRQTYLPASGSPSTGLASVTISPLVQRPWQSKQLINRIDRIVTNAFSPSLIYDELVLVEQRALFRHGQSTLGQYFKDKLESIFPKVGLNEIPEPGSLVVHSRLNSREVS